VHRPRDGEGDTGGAAHGPDRTGWAGRRSGHRARRLMVPCPEPMQDLQAARHPTDPPCQRVCPRRCRRWPLFLSDPAAALLRVLYSATAPRPGGTTAGAGAPAGRLWLTVTSQPDRLSRRRACSAGSRKPTRPTMADSRGILKVTEPSAWTTPAGPT
jgi:hypothetical protein